MVFPGSSRGNFAQGSFTTGQDEAGELRKGLEVRRRAGIRRQYSDDEKSVAIAILRANRGNLNETRRIVDIPVGTLRRWNLGDGYNPVVEMSQEERQRVIADRLETIIHRLLDIVPNKENEATLQQTMTSVAIAIDKMRLLREQPTSITQREQGVNAAELLERLRSALPDIEGPATIPMAPGHPSRLGPPG